MEIFVGVTDGDWYRLLAAQEGLEDLNFWQPGGSHVFRALPPGGLFLFKLHSPLNFIVGGGFFAHASILPVSLAWEAFGIGNGATSIGEMRDRIVKYRRSSSRPNEDYRIGCILLEQPFFLDESGWLPAPRDWHPNIVQGKRYDTAEPVGYELWSRIQEALAVPPRMEGAAPLGEPGSRYGEPILVKPRLGQGSFRIIVADAYERRCAITRERTLPALEAAHIRPFGEGGEHRVDNGLFLRRDLHALFDRGYLTITPQLQIEVSRRIREDFENGRDYYALQGKQVVVPMAMHLRPDSEHLAWHNDVKYLR
jgi:putative restriction endonuclease